jgi:hypothetical protein
MPGVNPALDGASTRQWLRIAFLTFEDLPCPAVASCASM